MIVDWKGGKARVPWAQPLRLSPLPLRSSALHSGRLSPADGPRRARDLFENSVAVMISTLTC